MRRLNKMRPRQPRQPRQVEKCLFCVKEKLPVFSEVEVLRQFITDRGKIISRKRSGICAKHQRRLATAIKRARHLALLPFVAR